MKIPPQINNASSHLRAKLRTAVWHNPEIRIATADGVAALRCIEAIQDIIDIIYREGPETEWDAETASMVADVLRIRIGKFQ